MSRYITTNVKEDLARKIVFIGGPRQVGKTTMGLEFLNPPSEKNPAYLNWDILEHRQRILKNQIPLQYPTLVFDEIHKYTYWRGLMKGLYDGHRQGHSFLVAGSARLDHFSKGGDSLMGRYYYYRLHPFSLLEMSSTPNAQDIESLMQFGGFPEPLFGQSVTNWKRWQNNRKQQVVHDDLRNLQYVKEVSLIELLLESLPNRVGSPLSVNSLREDIGVSHKSVESWLSLLESLYMVFRIPPCNSDSIRAVKKEKKLYFWDWSQVDDKGTRFENLTASHLLKYCHYQYDTTGQHYQLMYLRDVDKREVDFIVLKEKKPFFAVECKLGKAGLSPHLRYFQKRLNIPHCFQVHLSQEDFGDDSQGGRCLPFGSFCREFLKI